MTTDEITQFIFSEMKRQRITAKSVHERTGFTEQAIRYWRTGQRRMTMACAEKVLNSLGYELTIRKKEKNNEKSRHIERSDEEH